MKWPKLSMLSVAAIATFWGCGDVASVRVNNGFVQTSIVNGTRDPRAVALTQPQIRAIGWLYATGSPSQPFCTATLVASDLVVTAAHCVNGVGAGEIGFGVGVDPATPEALFNSTGVYPNRQVDAALIRLDQDATASGVEIEPIPMNQAVLPDTLVGKAVQAGGYGETRDSERGRWFATVFIDQVVADEVIVDGRGEQGICYGDSGSALIDVDGQGQPTVLAVESWGDESCVDIDHLTRLDAIYDWIEPVLNGQEPEDPCRDLGREGRCVDNAVESCRRGVLRVTDCSELGTQCLYFEQDDRHGCDCAELTEVGRCNGDVAEFCRDGRVVQFSCAMFGYQCGYDYGEQRYNCMASPACTPEDEVGRCEGDVAMRCQDSIATRELCAVQGLVCQESEQGADCVVVESDDAGTSTGKQKQDKQSEQQGCGCTGTDTIGAPWLGMWIMAPLLWRRLGSL